MCHKTGMHLPDGLLHPVVYGSLLGGGAAALAVAAKRCRNLEEESVPLMGILGAFVFAAQIVNVPVGAGTSGHLLGTALVTVLLGWEAAVVTMAAVLVLQAVMLQDGGLLALGANMVNMAVVPATIAALLCRLGPKRWRIFIGGGAAALGVLAAAVLVALELWLSRRASLGAALLGLGGTHVPIAVFEGVITLLILRFLLLVRPGLVRGLDRGAA